MAKVNVLIACTGGKKLLAKIMKELGSNAELKAKEINDAKMAKKNDTTDGIGAVDPNAKSAETHGGDLAENTMDHDFQEAEEKGLEQDSDGFWGRVIPDGLLILMMANNGNCFFQSISDQLTHDQGAGHEFVRYQITNHIWCNGDEFKNILLARDDDEEIRGLESYLHKMGQNGEWGGLPEVYAAAWFYGVDITIYSKDYLNTGGCLTFTADSPKGSNATSRLAWHISYHDNNHYNSVRSLDTVPCNSQYKSDSNRLEADLQGALDNHYHDCTHLAREADNAGSLVHPDDINTIRAVTVTVMKYIADRLAEVGGRKITEPQLQTLCIQVKTREALSPSNVAPYVSTQPKPMHPAVAQYEAELHGAINRYWEKVQHMLLHATTTDLTSSYDKLRSKHFPIMTGVASLILHFGGKAISMENLASLTNQAEAKALQLHADSLMTDEGKSNDNQPKIAEKASPDVIISPPEKPKPSLKAGKFFSVFSNTAPPRQQDEAKMEGNEDSKEPGIYSKTINGAGDGTHNITTSFIKNNDKIKDQLLTHFTYFLKLMCANIEGLKICPVNTERKLPILILATNKNIPITGTKIRDYFFVQNEFSLIPGT